MSNQSKGATDDRILALKTREIERRRRSTMEDNVYMGFKLKLRERKES